MQASGRSAALQSADGSTDEASAQWLVAVPAATTTFPSRCVGDVVCRNLHMLRDTPLMHTCSVIQTAHIVNMVHLQQCFASICALLEALRSEGSPESCSFCSAFSDCRAMPPQPPQCKQSLGGDAHPALEARMGCRAFVMGVGLDIQ